MKAKKRVDYIDVLRGIGIIYMVLGHINFGAQFDHYIHAFHMPLFFFVTGLFYRRESLPYWPFLKKMTKQLILPYLIWGIVILSFSFLTKMGLRTSMIEAIGNFFTTNNNGIPIAGALWYLTCLYFSQIILYFLNRIFKKEWTFGISCMIVFMLGIVLHHFQITLWWSLVNSFVAIGIIYFGCLMKKIHLLEKFTNTNLIYTLILFVVSFYSIMHTGYVNMRTGVYPNLFLFFLNLILAILFYVNVSKILLKFRFFSFFTQKIKYIGENSIVSLCFNQIVILIFNFLLQASHISTFLLNIVGNSLLLYNLFLFVLVIVVLYFLTKLFTETKLRILFGK